MKYSLLILLFLCSISSSAQMRYIVYLKDKSAGDVTYYEHNLSLLLSPEAIERRQAQGINIDHFDIPVNEEVVKNLSRNYKVISTSKWLNAVLIESNESSPNLLNLPEGVVRVEKINLNTSSRSVAENKSVPGQEIKILSKGTAFDYGAADKQNSLLNIQHLHNKGFTGKGVTIAVLDVGFKGVNIRDHFDALHNEDRILHKYDFWDSDTSVYDVHDHGTIVLSAMAANKSGSMIGTAPEANFLLAIADDLVTETHQDEYNWAKALEWADSLGADIVSSSLSYDAFDPGEGNYTYADMDGRTTITAKAAQIAAAKGLIIVNSAGNSGTLKTPCDADSILCVGGANDQKDYDSMSAVGPAFDGRIKPDVAALTKGFMGVSEDGLEYHFYAGTSASTPMISGLVACLKEAHPKRTSYEIIDAVRKSGHLYANPSSQIGYGVPDAKVADSVLTALDNQASVENKAHSGDYTIFPNPFTDKILINKAGAGVVKMELFSSVGVLVKQAYLKELQNTVSTEEIEPGIYIIRITGKNGSGAYSRIIKL